MKRSSLFSLALLAGASLFGAKKATKINNVEPPYRWTGIQNDTMKVMVKVPGISDATVNHH